MTFVDERGRVAGRVNLVDALAALLILVLIPVAYGAYVVFRTPQPTLSSIEPARLFQGRNLRIAVNGKNLRPFMRVSFSTIQGRTFLIGSTKRAEVDLPDLEPGVYDVQLFDYMQQVDQLPKALTILPQAPTPTVQMDVSGAFHGLPDAVVALIHPGTQLKPAVGDSVADVLAVGGGSPAQLRLRVGDDTVTVPIEGQQELRATLRIKCYVVYDADGMPRCQMSGPQQPVTVQRDANLTLPGPQGWISFQISEVRSAATLPPAGAAGGR